VGRRGEPAGRRGGGVADRAMRYLSPRLDVGFRSASAPRRPHAVMNATPSPRTAAGPLARRPRLTIPRLAGVCLTVAGGWLAGAATAVGPDADFAAFARDDAPRIRALIDVDDREWRQIEPTLWLLAARHAASLETLGAEGRIAALGDLAGFVERLRDAHAEQVVLGADRRVIGLLDPDRGLDPKEITTIAAAYGAPAEVWKQGQGGPTGPDTKEATAEGFLEAVNRAARDGRPTTVVVLGHGLKDEIQSYSIPCARLAAALLGGAANRVPESGPPTIDLSHMVIVCDDCFSADFLENLGQALERGSARSGATLVALPACIAGTNRDRYGIADFGEKFVPHFWKDVIELYYVRRPLPDSVALVDFFDSVDAMMDGYGRAPMLEGGRVTGYRLVNPDLVQDPVVFVSLDDDDLAELRRILGLPADAPLPRLFDIG